MNLLPRIHTLYVARVVTVTVLLTWAVLVGVDLVISGLLSEIDNIGEGQYGAVSALTYVLYTVPRRAYMMFPTAAVIGTLMGLGQLAASSELTALRALGLSRRRISLAAAAPLAVDVGYGASHTTTVEWAGWLRQIRPDIEVVGLEINPERVLPPRDGVRFELGPIF